MAVPTIQQKQCSTCKAQKPLADFSTDRKKPDGLCCYCKACAAAIRRRYAERTKRQETCSYCGKTFIRLGDRLKLKRQFCSRECNNAGQRQIAQRGAQSKWWNGGRTIRDGYVYVYMPGHPKAKTADGSKGYVNEHVLIAERALGKVLPEGAVVHHVNSVRHDNKNSNLVICQDERYHKLLHRRTRIVEAGGDPNTQKICSKCHAVKDLTEFRRDKTNPCGRYNYCNECSRRIEIERRRAKAA